MATQTLARPTFGSMEHLRRPTSVLDRVAERQNTLARLKARARHGVERTVDNTKATGKRVLIRSALVGGGAFAFGALQGGLQEKMMIGGHVPLDLLGAIALHGAAFAVEPELGKVLHGLGDGAFAVFTSTWGRAFGRRIRQAITGQPAPTVAGVPPEGGGALSNEELARLARRGG